MRAQQMSLPTTPTSSHCDKTDSIHPLAAPARTTVLPADAASTSRQSCRRRLTASHPSGIKPTAPFMVAAAGQLPCCFSVKLSHPSHAHCLQVTKSCSCCPPPLVLESLIRCVHCQDSCSGSTGHSLLVAASVCGHDLDCSSGKVLLCMQHRSNPRPPAGSCLATCESPARAAHCLVCCRPN